MESLEIRHGLKEWFSIYVVTYSRVQLDLFPQLGTKSPEQCFFYSIFTQDLVNTCSEHPVLFFFYDIGTVQRKGQGKFYLQKCVQPFHIFRASCVSQCSAFCPLYIDKETKTHRFMRLTQSPKGRSSSDLDRPCSPARFPTDLSCYFKPYSLAQEKSQRK